jgi:hypothetical protein
MGVRSSRQRRVAPTGRRWVDMVLKKVIVLVVRPFSSPFSRYAEGLRMKPM